MDSGGLAGWLPAIRVAGQEEVLGRGDSTCPLVGISISEPYVRATQVDVRCNGVCSSDTSCVVHARATQVYVR